MDPADPELNDNLRQLAARIHAERGSPASFQPTELLHEAWLKLGAESGHNDRVHFVAVAARAMRQVVIDRALSGMTVTELVQATTLSRSTMDRHWCFGPAFLSSQLAG